MLEERPLKKIRGIGTTFRSQWSLNWGARYRGIGGEVAPPPRVSPVDKNSVFLTLTVEQLRVIRHFCQGGMWFRTGPRATFSKPADTCTLYRVFYPSSLSEKFSIDIVAVRQIVCFFFCRTRRHACLGSRKFSARCYCINTDWNFNDCFGNRFILILGFPCRVADYIRLFANQIHNSENQVFSINSFLRVKLW